MIDGVGIQLVVSCQEDSSISLTALPTNSVNVEISPKRYQRRLAIYCANTKKAPKIGLEEGKEPMTRSTHKKILVGPLERNSRDVILDKNGQTIDNQEGNLRFQRLLSLYYIEKYQYAPTHIHRSLIRIEFLDELKSLGVRCFTTARTSAVSPEEEDEQTPSFVTDVHRQGTLSHMCLPLNDEHALLRIRKAFIALSAISKMATKKKVTV